jgi:hypothetical protein
MISEIITAELKQKLDERKRWTVTQLRRTLHS